MEQPITPTPEHPHRELHPTVRTIVIVLVALLVAAGLIYTLSMTGILAQLLTLDVPIGQ